MRRPPDSFPDGLEMMRKQVSVVQHCTAYEGNESHFKQNITAFFFHTERGKSVLLLENESDAGTLSLGKALPSPEQKGD